MDMTHVPPMSGADMAPFHWLSRSPTSEPGKLRRQNFPRVRMVSPAFRLQKELRNLSRTGLSFCFAFASWEYPLLGVCRSAT